jgi:hypothetical protein
MTIQITIPGPFGRPPFGDHVLTPMLVTLVEPPPRKPPHLTLVDDEPDDAEVTQ